MDFKPNEFFIGLVEFITILLPGALLSFVLLMVEACHPIQKGGKLYKYAFNPETDFVFWVAFVFTSFGAGYFLNSFASGLDPLYDSVRKQYGPYNEELEKSFREKHSRKEGKIAGLHPPTPGSAPAQTLEEFKISYANKPFRKVLAVIFKLTPKVKIDESHEQVHKILKTQDEAVRKASNAFKWAGTVLEAHYPVISEQATRLMAASKFFRSIVILCLFIALLQLPGLIQRTLWEFNLVIMLLSFREYIVLRQKSVQKTYQSIVTLTYYQKSNTEETNNNQI